MKFELWQIGKTSFAYLRTGIAEYEKRLQRYMSFKTQTLPDIRNGGKLPEQLLIEKEGELVLNKLEPGDHLILLDEHGKAFRSVEFSNYIQKLQHGGYRRVIFLIGGAYGFSEAVKNRASATLSLSKMTFNHQMVRLFFIEQLYRAQTILRNEPYHNE